MQTPQTTSRAANLLWENAILERAGVCKFDMDLENELLYIRENSLKEAFKVRLSYRFGLEIVVIWMAFGSSDLRVTGVRLV
jgi:hypothetical protein